MCSVFMYVRVDRCISYICVNYLQMLHFLVSLWELTTIEADCFLFVCGYVLYIDLHHFIQCFSERQELSCELCNDS